MEQWHCWSCPGRGAAARGVGAWPPSPRNTSALLLEFSAEGWEHEALGQTSAPTAVHALTFAWQGVSSGAFRFSPTLQEEDFIVGLPPAGKIRVRRGEGKLIMAPEVRAAKRRAGLLLCDEHG